MQQQKIWGALEDMRFLFLDKCVMIKNGDIMKRLTVLLALLVLLSGCGAEESGQVAATTLPVYTFTTLLCQGTPITVTRLVTENVSCLHDYTLKVDQMRAVEQAELVVISGAGLEDFLEDALQSAQTLVDASQGLTLLEGGHDHGHEGHVHTEDPHIWLSPVNAKAMAANICRGLQAAYPAYKDIFEENLASICARLDALQAYGEAQLAQLRCRELITFHDGFTYLAESFGLHIVHAVEEESGSEASASELIELIGLVREHQLPAIFTETNGSDAAASIIAAETGVQVFALDMAMSGEDYFGAMRRNIDTLKEALQ